jgi:glycosyltransferase involved in cell wall biosynthesis
MNPVDAKQHRVLRSLWRDRPFLDLSDLFRRARYRASTSPRRLLYLAGKVDALGIFREELLGVDGRRELAIPFSRQVLDVSQALGAGVLTIVESSRSRMLDHGRVRIEEHRIPFNRERGAAYHLGRLFFIVKVAWIAWCFRPQVVLASTSAHWFTLAILSWMNIKIVASLDSTFWPQDHPPLSRLRRATLKMNGWFWREHVVSTIGVSDECARQVREISGDPGTPVKVVVAQYPEDLPPRTLPPADGPFRVLFAGRLDRTEGVWDVLAAAHSLQNAYPGRFAWTLAGDGVELEPLRAAVEKASLAEIMSVAGHLSPHEYISAIDGHHMVISPSNSGFSGGVQKVALEGMLRGRPVVTTMCSNSSDKFGPALIKCEEKDPASIAGAVLKLADDSELYWRVRSESLRCSNVFFDRSQGYAEAVRATLEPLWE